MLLDKDFINMQRKLKKLSGKGHNVENEDVEVEIQVTPESSVSIMKKIFTLKMMLKRRWLMILLQKLPKRKDVYTRDATNTLPDLRGVWQNHHLMAVYVEKCIGEELVQHGGFYIPDGTSYNGKCHVWEMSATVLKINGKIRANKSTENWERSLLNMSRCDLTHASKIDCCIRT